MQIHHLHPSIYKLSCCVKPEQNLPEEIKIVKTKLEQCSKLLKKKVPWNEIAEIIGISRSNYYRLSKLVKTIGYLGLMRKSKRPKKLRTSKIPQESKNLIFKIRTENPTYGKAKIAVILKRDNQVYLSESSVGRVLKKMIESGKIKRSISALKIKRKRNFKGHAKPWEYGKIKPTLPGQLIQIDHMTAVKHQVTCKHFQGWDPVSKYIGGQIFSTATSRCARRFLEHLVATAPFKITGIQVDGGSEFMDEFEKACSTLQIELYVLPPKRPQYNGGVERGNRTFREEFYARDDLTAESVGAFNYELKKALSKYNTYRPHHSIDYLTPMQYINNLNGAA